MLEDFDCVVLTDLPSLGVLTNGRDSQKQTVMSLTNAQSQALLQQVTHTLPRITHILLIF
jgi:hypothetical protein